MIISTERSNTSEMKSSLGISQASGGSCTGVGGYAESLYNPCKCKEDSTAQFQVSDERSQADVAKTLLKWLYSKLLYCLLS